jgi:hypothetical protein
MTWDCGTGYYFNFFVCRPLVLNIFSFPVTTAKFIGELQNNRRSAAQRYLGFAYSFVSLKLRQHYWRCDSYSAYRRSAANVKKIREFSVLIGAANAPRFAYRCGEDAPLRLLAQGAALRE